MNKVLEKRRGVCKKFQVTGFGERTRLEIIVEDKGFLREALEICKNEKQSTAAEIAAQNVPFPKWVSKQRPVFDIAVQENLDVGARLIPNAPRPHSWSDKVSRCPRDLWWQLRSAMIAEASDVINAVSHLE